MDRVEVFWIDGSSLIGESFSEEEAKALTPVRRRSIGYIVKEDEDEITITFGIYEWAKPRYDKTISILKKSIEKYVELDSGVEHLL